MGVNFTYVVGLGEADELLDGERVVWVAIGMLLQGHLSVLLLDVAGSGVRRNVKNSERIKGLQRLNLRNNRCVDVPDVPKEGSCDNAEVEAAFESLRASFSLFESQKCGIACSHWRTRKVFNVGFSPNKLGDNVPSDGDQDEGQE